MSQFQYISLMKNLKKMVAELLEELEVGYVINEEKSSFEFDLQAEYVKVSMCLVFHEANRMLYNLSYLTSCLPRESMTDVLYKINEIHYMAFNQAHMYLSVDDCRLMAQAMINVPEDGLSLDVFANFLLATCNLLNDNYNDLMKVAYERKVESKMIYTKLNADDDFKSLGLATLSECGRPGDYFIMSAPGEYLYEDVSYKNETIKKLIEDFRQRIQKL